MCRCSNIAGTADRLQAGFRRGLILTFTVAFLLAMPQQQSYAQNLTATILGTARDASEAVMPKVTVTATNVNTNISRTIATDDEGNYELALLPIGDYKVTAELAGFKKAERSGITLQLERKIRVDFTLEVGEVTDTVSVIESAPVVEAYTIDRGVIVDTVKIAELPLLGRNYTDLLKLMPNVVDRRNIDGDAQGRYYGGALVEPYTFGGVRPLQNQFYLDGVNNTDPFWQQIVIRPSIDALQEFNVKLNQYNAEFGGGGAVVNAAIKSGTNDFHGALFDFLQNDNLNARNFFSPVKSEFKYNQFGGVIGGPVIIPKLYNGRDRTFFLFNYEGLRRRSPADRLLRVPTEAELRGDFSFLPYQLYDPVNLDPVTGERLAFAGNIIPQSRWHHSVASILPYWPAPNMPLNERNQNFFAQRQDTNDTDQFTVRVDQKIYNKNMLFYRYTQGEQEDLSAESWEGSGGIKFNVKSFSTGLGLTTTLSPTLLNELRFNYARRTMIAGAPPTLGTNYDALFGFASADQITEEEYFFPGIGIQNINGFGSGYGASYVIGPGESWGLNEILTWIKGSHSFKFGFHGERYYNNGSYLIERSWNFNGLYSALIRDGQLATNGYGFADFLLGAPWLVVSNPSFPGVGRAPYRFIDQSLKGFFQDDWKVSPRVTLNYGVRYEYNMPPVEAHDRTLVGNIRSLTDIEVLYPEALDIDDQFLSPQFSVDTPVPGGGNQVVPAGRYFRRHPSRRMWDPDKNNFQPRIGLAIRPFRDDRTAIRAAYGVFNGRTNGSVSSGPAFSPPFFNFSFFNADSAVPPDVLLGEFPGGTTYSSEGFPGTFYLLPRDFPDPFIQNWSLTIQRELATNMKFEVGYLGSRTDNMYIGLVLNARRVPGMETGQGCPEPCSVPRPFPRPFPYMQEDRSSGPYGWANYHAMQVSLERRFSQGLTFLTSFTWSKSMDLGVSGAGDFVEGGQPDGQPQNLFNLAAEKGRGQDSIGRRFVGSWVYELPFGSGKPFLANSNSFVKAVVSGWQFSGVLGFQGGFPLSVYVFGDVSGTGITRGRADRIRDGNLPNSERTLQRWFDTSAFTIPALNTFGNGGNRILEGPGLKNLDLGLHRNFRFSERHNLQFRAEFFNTTNTPNFASPDRFVNSVTYGQIYQLNTPMRQIQLALKYIF